jgi:Tfp pilus assembly protein PilF
MNTGPRRLTILALLCCGAAVLSACASSPRGGPYTPLTDGDRDPARAQELTLEAAEIAPDDPVKAEAMLREALTADLYHGPAHNNLGVLFLQQARLYEAAGEFEWARKLMPGHPEPRLNLAMTLERAGRIDEAIGTYRTALEVYPDHVPTFQALARAQLMHGRADDSTGSMLDEIALRGETEAWRDWARAQRPKLHSAP